MARVVAGMLALVLAMNALVVFFRFKIPAYLRLSDGFFAPQAGES